MSRPPDGKPNDGLGWYIMEQDASGARSVRHYNRYNLRCAATSSAAVLFKGEDLFTMFWDGKAWHDDRP